MKDIIQIDIEIPNPPMDPDLAKNDRMIQSLDKIMQERKKFLLEKRHSLQDLERSNEYIHDIHADYKKYYQYITEEKRNQMRSMDQLLRYIDRIIQEGKLTEADIKRGEWEQQKIMMEIANIRQDLDEITQQI